MKPFAWYDHFNEVFIRDQVLAARAHAGGNKVTPVYTEGELPDRRFTAAVAAIPMAMSSAYVESHPIKERLQLAAKFAVEVADALLAELAK